MGRSGRLPAVDLCVVCFRATAGGTLRWSWLACENCRAINDGIREVWGSDHFRSVGTA